MKPTAVLRLIAVLGNLYKVQRWSVNSFSSVVSFALSVNHFSTFPFKLMHLLLIDDQNSNRGFPYLTFFLRTIRVWLKRDSGQYWPSIYHTVSCKSDSSAQMGTVLVLRCLTLCLLLLQRRAPACRTTMTADASS